MTVPSTTHVSLSPSLANGPSEPAGEKISDVPKPDDDSSAGFKTRKNAAPPPSSLRPGQAPITRPSGASVRSVSNMDTMVHSANSDATRQAVHPFLAPRLSVLEKMLVSQTKASALMQRKADYSVRVGRFVNLFSIVISEHLRRMYIKPCFDILRKKNRKQKSSRSQDTGLIGITNSVSASSKRKQNFESDRKRRPPEIQRQQSDEVRRSEVESRILEALDLDSGDEN